MIAITGSTGQLGKGVIEALLKKVPATDIVALARDVGKAQSFTARGIQVRKADYRDPSGWDAALTGITKLLLISSNELGQRATQHQTVIQAAKHAGVSLIAYTSVLHADRSELGLAKEHRQTEADLKASGVPYVVLRNGWYSENYTVGIKSAVEHGAVFGAAGEGRISSAPREQYAEAAAVVLTQSENPVGKVYELAGDASYTLSDFAAQIAKRSGKKIAYQNLSKPDYEALLIKAGLPAPLADLLADSDAAAAKGALYDEGHELSRLIGKPTIAIADSVAQALP